MGDNVGPFLDVIVPAMRQEVAALLNGDPGPRKALWSHEEPVSLFGAEATSTGWAQIEPIFDRLAESFTEGRDCSYQVLAAGVSGDLAYVAAIERSMATTPGASPDTFELRVTTIFRREHGQWRVVHRHGDPRDPGSRAALDRRRQHGAM